MGIILDYWDYKEPLKYDTSPRRTQYFIDVVTGVIGRFEVSRTTPTRKIQFESWYKRNWPLPHRDSYTTVIAELNVEKKYWEIKQRYRAYWVNKTLEYTYVQITTVYVPEELWEQCIAYQIYQKL